MEDDVHNTFLKQKTNLQDLNLKWMAHDTTQVDNESVQGVLDYLEPPPRIKALDIHGYSGMQYAQWMQDQVGGGVQGPAPFPFLSVMKLYDFPNLKHLDGLVELPSLVELELHKMPCLESISGGPFPSLVKLEMDKLPCLGEVWMIAESTMPNGEEGGGCYNNFTPQLGQVRVGNCLTELDISDCPKLEVKPHLPPLLQHFRLWRSEQLLQSPGQCLDSSSSSSFSHPKKLQLWNVTGVGPGYKWELLQLMKTLDSLVIYFCPELIELPESLCSLTSLRSLKVSSCSCIRMLPESIGQLRSLQELIIQSCQSLSGLPQSLGHLTYLQELIMADCDSLTSLPQSMGHLRCLQKLVIEACNALHQLPDCLGELCSLRKLEINHLRGLTCLPQSICSGMKSLPEGMESLVSLEKLCVCNCPGIHSLPEGIKGLTTLKELWIYSCPDLVRRCEKGKGEDWHLVSHIPQVWIG